MKTLTLILVVALTAFLAVACGSSGSDDQGRSLPPTNGEYERVLRLAGDNVATPDFTLRSSSGEFVRLSDYRGKKPLAIIFYRGFF